MKKFKNFLWAVFVQPLILIAQNKIGLAGFIVLLVIIFMSFVGPYIIPLDTKVKLDKIYQPPSWEHILGTDSEGKDVFSQIVHGGKAVLTVAFLAALFSTMIAVTLGITSGFVGGRTDNIIMFITEVVLTIPQFPLLAVLAAFIRLSNPTLLAFILGAVSWPALTRAIRSQALSLRERDFIEAAKILDLGALHIIFSEILPNMMSYITISFVMAMTGAIYSQVGLILLGLVPLSGQNWGIMIQLAWTRGAIFFKDSLSYILSPILAIVLFQWSAVSFTRSLEGIFNPRLRVRR
ncbi:MAG: peptide/nickel transport system permease protein [Thermotogaceae bacterium]|jgi:peptide/nickel transport system permease protein|nr:peptide/nickel transport system permease protein [Thermotogaceae bacterium]MDN5338858.1 peptide/nickel transport system permease protein [Thermotogaceae bacterium]